VLRVDVRRTRRARDLEGVEERALHRRRDDGAVDVGGRGCGGEALLGGAGDRARVGADVLDGVTRRRIVDEDAQHVQRIQLALAALEGEPAGALEHLLRPRAEEAAEVDRPLGAGALTREVPSKELVERAAAVVAAGEGGEVFGHSISLKVE
jgi:hypothetical protein